MTLDRRQILTMAIVFAAVVLVLLKYWHYVFNPWTRDGQVRADVIQVTSRVTGPIVELPIRDNQYVAAGDLLFRIDQRTFEAEVARARAEVDGTSDSVLALDKQVDAARAAVDVAQRNIDRAESQISADESTIKRNKAELDRQQDLLPKQATSRRALEAAQANYEVSQQQKLSAEAQLAQARAGLKEAEATLAEAEAKLGAAGNENAQLRKALAALRTAELNLEFTEVRAPVDGYVTNLSLRVGTQAVANQPALALVDVSSYRVDGFFRENAIADIKPGDHAVVTLMTYPDTPLRGVVDSIGWGISQSDGSTGYDLLPNIAPSFSWIRLAQRVPVRIRLEPTPDDVQLRVGTSCSVLVETGTADEVDDSKPLAVPSALQ